MIWKRCSECGVECWHNERRDPTNSPRCTFCGHPPGGGPNTWKKAYQQYMVTRQVTKARTMSITTSGVPK